MCGICGAIGFDRPDFIKEMSQRMVHRGPDDINFFYDAQASLGHTRLSIIDPSASGHQPMSNEDETVWVTFNGEIYNFQDLRMGLEKKGHLFKSKTDTEVIIHLYEEYGDECLGYLRGMFSFAIWDKKKRRLLAARDRLGIKPLFYYLSGKRLVFASELKALLACGFIKKDINTRALRDYFTFGSVRTPETMIKNVFQLSPAHYLVFERSELSIKRYWRLEAVRKTPVKTEQEYTYQIKDALDEAVKIRMISDVPLGAFLSGGVDSSTIVALMQRHSPRPVKTFSVVFEESAYDEREFSKKVASLFGTDHKQIFLDEEGILKHIPDIFDSMDQPSVDGFNTFIISKAVKDAGITVALSGLGGDELFIGYSLFRTLPIAFNALKALRFFPRAARIGFARSLKRLARTKRGLKAISSLLECERLEDLYFLKRSVFLPDDVDDIITAPAETSPCDTGYTIEKEGVDIINQLSLLDISNYLQDTLLQDTDRMSMASSLEVRVPFMDHILVEKALQIPGDMKADRNNPKKLLIRSMQELLPGQIYARPKKGFVLPFDRWLKGKLKDYCAERFSHQNLKNIPFLNSKKIDYIWNNFLKGSGLHNYSSILTMISFVNWYKRTILK